MTLNSEDEVSILNKINHFCNDDYKAFYNFKKKTNPMSFSKDYAKTKHPAKVSFINPNQDPT